MKVANELIVITLTFLPLFEYLEFDMMVIDLCLTGV